MIIGEALRTLIEGKEISLTINGTTITRNLKFGYGDQKELNKWIADKKTDKYPLIWYVINPYNDLPNGEKQVRSRLIIMQSTEVSWFNTKRYIKSYSEVIEPTWMFVRKLLERNKYINILGSLGKKYFIKDEPNYGVEAKGFTRTGQTDFVGKKKYNEQSALIDIVDARIIDLELIINTNCIL